MAMRGIATLVFCVTAPLLAPGTALAGGDEEAPAPPSAGPPGPWNDAREAGEGEDVP